MSPTPTDRERDLQRAYLVAAALLAVGMALEVAPPRDDGLRHVGLAFAETARSWGQVYPFSRFEAHADYDPWGGYDLTLRGLAGLTGALPFPRLARQFIVVELLQLLFVGTFMWLCVRRSRVAREIRDAPKLLLAIAVTSVVLIQPVLRMALIRPFAFGTFLLLYSVGKTGLLRGLVSAAVAWFMYPYLAWMYAGPVVVAHLLRGSRSFAAGAALSSAAALLLQPADFWQLVLELIVSDGVRASLDTQITEFAPLTQQKLLLLAIVLAAFLLVPRLPPGARRLRVEHVMALLFVPISFKYVRYVVDVQLPLLFVAHGADLVRALRPPLERTLSAWGPLLRPRSGDAAPPGPDAPARPPRGFRAALSLGYLVLALLLIGRLAAQHDRLSAQLGRLRPIPGGSRVLTAFNRQYEILYARPDLSIVPSCEIGFPADSIREAYVGYINQGRVCTLARRVGAAYYVDGRSLYLDPADTDCLELISEDDHQRVWRVRRHPAGGPGPLPVSG
ncbi:MAG: hypothetical protein PVI30_10810 [Myxococcales bacterium]